MSRATDVLDRFKEKDNQKKNNIIDWEEVQARKKARADGREPSVIGNERFVKRIEGGLYDMTRLKDILKSPVTCLLYLLFWAGNKKGGPNKKTKRWYKKGFIVATQSQEQIALDLDISERTVRRWIKGLHQSGLIIIEKDGPIKNVYVLGLVYKDGSEGYFYSGSALPYRKP